MTDIENDKPGTVRVSPEGVTALRTDPAHGSQTGHVWALSKAHNHSYWVKDEHVKNWAAIYKPPIPNGTVKYRVYESLPEWDDDEPAYTKFEVAVKTNKGWIWVDQNGARTGVEPADNANGKWTVVELLG